MLWMYCIQNMQFLQLNHKHLVTLLNAAAAKHGWRGRNGKLEIPNLTKGKEFQKLLVDIRDEYLAESDDPIDRTMQDWELRKKMCEPCQHPDHDNDELNT